MLATAFFWGALVAVFIAFLFNTASRSGCGGYDESRKLVKSFGAVISAPIVEETAKAFILFIFFFARDEFDGVVDGIVYAGNGRSRFAMTENVMYYGPCRDARRRMLTGRFHIAGRSLHFRIRCSPVSPASVWGWRANPEYLRQIMLPVLDWHWPLMHSIWNGSRRLVVARVFITYVLIMVPVFAIMLSSSSFGAVTRGPGYSQVSVQRSAGGVFTVKSTIDLAPSLAGWESNFNAFSRGGLGQLAHQPAAHQTGKRAGLPPQSHGAGASSSPTLKT